MSSHPSVTPPAHVRTLEQLDEAVTRLEEQKGEDYAAIRELKETVGVQHLASMAQGGELAKMLGEALELLKALAAEVQRLRAVCSGLR